MDDLELARALVAAYGGGQKTAGTKDWRAAIARILPGHPVAAASEGIALQLMAHGRHPEAEACLREALTRAPQSIPLLRRLAQVLRVTGAGNAWTVPRRQSLELEVAAKGLPPEEIAAATAFVLAAEGLAPMPTTAPPGLVAHLFTVFADFDELLVDRLRYQAPALLLQALAPHLPQRPWRVCDAGCGTGLMGVALAGRVAELWGIDLSAAMVERARARGIYHRLIAGELVAVLAGMEERWDAVVAADVCPYLGDLAPLVRAAQARLAPGGCLGLTAEAADPDVRWTLGATRRYAHGSRYLEELCATAGLAVCTRSEAVLRYEQGMPVHGHVLVARRDA